MKLFLIEIYRAGKLVRQEQVYAQTEGEAIVKANDLYLTGSGPVNEEVRVAYLSQPWEHK